MEIISPLREITCHMGSHSVTSPATWQRSLSCLYGTPAEAGTWDASLSWPRWWLHPKIIYPPKRVSTCLRNNQAVSWEGFELTMRKPWIQCPNHYTTKPPYKCSLLRSAKWLWTALTEEPTEKMIVLHTENCKPNTCTGREDWPWLDNGQWLSSHRQPVVC